MSVREMDWSDQKIPNVDLTTELSPSRHEPADHSVNHAALAWLRALSATTSQREKSLGSSKRSSEPWLLVRESKSCGHVASRLSDEF